ncbi:hypothetical protein PLEOSDRAFT_1105337 [Pleurotus ostreatus PC15]|uniref:Uncharacterized protein n=1 Tax=Pleurotus ostreatus (strain PC15) TaxID=1137138 RepID=A0A067NEH9_PLEO1|nr:hypothetical protein PLEOSDRAFT_1105337 [Pleurotus ostreatus PC15]
MGGLDMNDQAMQAEFAQIPPLMLDQYKSEIGIPDMKPAVVRSRQGAIPRLFGIRLVNLHRAKREQAGVNTAAAPFGPQPGQRAGNRNGTSPGEEVPHFNQALGRQTPVPGAGMTNGLLPHQHRTTTQ